MGTRRGWLPREGFTADVVFKLIDRTALNPALLLPLVLISRYTKRGENLSILHPTATRRIKTLFYLGLARWLNNLYSRAVLNNWRSDKYDWSKEIVVITGGSSGIGSHIAQLLAERKIKVVVLDVQALSFEPGKILCPMLTTSYSMRCRPVYDESGRDGGKRTVERERWKENPYTSMSHTNLEANQAACFDSHHQGPNIHYFECDITSPAELSNVATSIREQVGEPTILINNAGTTHGKSLLEGSERETRSTFEVNTLAHYWTVREFVPAMIRANHGMVVTVASLASWVSSPGMVDYAASKAAARALHEGLSAELLTHHEANRVRTVLVCPGLTKTDLFDGCQASNPFIVPKLEAESVAEATVQRILCGESGQVVMPAFGNVLAGLGAFPLWYQMRVRKTARSLMLGFRGRQVTDAKEGHYADSEKGTLEGTTEGATVGGGDGATETSTVFVPES